ncbi:hypothetical protein [Telluribacter sp.]|jgi:hypothetical protein|uniref:hypothetical protein n=1 Tax=Telluribacter sp. TaxID=1978767 RepID=UPI002E162622|nr:hypothetical protein [Telluribacter sp.]
MSNLENIQRRVSEGVSGWLLFEFNCSRGYLFNEKYLSYPIGQILNSITEYKTLTEINHPCSNSGQGRPLQVDFVLTDKSTKWKYAFEAKWIAGSLISLGSIIWDLIRLQNLGTYHSEVRCYFILAGFDKKINLLLKDFDICHNKASTKKNEIAKTNSTYLIFDLLKLNKSTTAYLNKKINKYPNFKLYSKIRCRPAHRSPKNDIINMTFSTYIFEVLKPDGTHIINKL